MDKLDKSSYTTFSLGMFVSFERIASKSAIFPIFGTVNLYCNRNKIAMTIHRNDLVCIVIRHNRPFTNTAAILNLLDLRGIMGCLGDTRSAFTRLFRAKRELQYIFLGKKVIIITSKQGTTIYFSHYNFKKLKEKSAHKAGVNTDSSISDRAHAPWASYNTP